MLFGSSVFWNVLCIVFMFSACFPAFDSSLDIIIFEIFSDFIALANMRMIAGNASIRYGFCL